MPELNFIGIWKTECGKIAEVSGFEKGKLYPWTGTISDDRGIKIPGRWDEHGNEQWDPNLNLKQRKRSEEDKTF